jgi:ABC-type multidrug transport system fused ATPase/permease subunit
MIHPVTGLVILLTGVYFHRHNQLTTGDVATCFMWAMTALAQVNSVCDLQRNMAKQVTDINNLIEMVSEEPDVVEIENPVKPELTGQIEFKDVVFAYKPRQRAKSENEDDDDDDIPKEEEKLPVLRGVSFKINPGERVAFVGRSGAGKSTIIQALLRAKDPAHGEILVDGHDLKTLDLHHYRSAVGIVEQNVQLFDKSLRYNLTFGCNGNSDAIGTEQLDAVCTAAGVSRFFNRLDHGYDTLLGERGVKLSGGQCQRIGIARALIKNPAILILDEATNSLDAENEMLIREALEASGHNRTTLIIAHRLNTIRDCDKILVVDDGRVIDQGTHDELMGKCEVYQTLVTNQLK